MKTKGWKNVFSFTFVQYIKTKAFIVSTIISCIFSIALCVLTNVLPVVLNNDSSDGFVSADDPDGTGEPGRDNFFASGKLYLFDEAGILPNEDISALGEFFKGGVDVPEKAFDEVIEELKASEGQGIAVKITERTDKDGALAGYEIKSHYSKEAKGAADSVNNVLAETVNRRILLNAGVAPEKYADTRVFVETSKIEAGGKALNALQGMVNYALPMLISIVLFLLIFTYGSIVAQSIATEKTSRVMELLLTSVRPLAVVIGKVLAMGVVCILQFALIIGVGAASLAITMPFGWLGKASEIMKNPEIMAAVSGSAASGTIPGGISSSELEIAQTVSDFQKAVTPANIAAIVLVFILGFLFFSLIAALIGASISRMEDLQSAMSPYSLIGVLGMYLAYFPVIFNADSLASGESVTNPVQMFSYFFPVSSPFALPSAILLGSLSPAQIALSIAAQAVFVVLIAVVVGKVYEAIILHNGNRIKLGDMLKMAVRK